MTLKKFLLCSRKSYSDKFTGCKREDACMSLDELSILQEKQDSYAHCQELLLMAENEILNGTGTGASR